MAQEDHWHGREITASIWVQSANHDGAQPADHLYNEWSFKQYGHWNDWKAFPSKRSQPHNDEEGALTSTTLYDDPTTVHQTRWEPYWVKCKTHGWHQCPACINQIASMYRVLPKQNHSPGGESFQRMRKNSPQRKHIRRSGEDELDFRCGSE